MSEDNAVVLPGEDVYPEVIGVKIAEWGEWDKLQYGKAFRRAVTDDGRPVKVYLSGTVLDGNGGGIVQAPPYSRIQSSQDARDLRARRYEKARESISTGLARGASASELLKDRRPGTIDEYTALEIIGETMFDIATNKERGRDAVMAAKYIGEAADFIPRAGKVDDGPGPGGVRITFEVGDVGAFLEGIRAVRAGLAGGSSEDDERSSG